LIPTISPEQLKAATDPKYWAFLDRFTIPSMLIAPLRASRRVIGAITMARTQPGRPYTDDDLGLLQDLADRAALGITNARLFEQAQRELAERTRVEEEIRRLNIELEQRVADRTTELQAALNNMEALYTITRAAIASENLVEALQQVAD